MTETTPYVHISYNRLSKWPTVQATLPSLKDPEVWKQWAAALSYEEGSYYPRSGNELRKLKAFRKALESSIPDPFKEGTHLVAAQTGFMGEPLWIHHGTLHTATHLRHHVCGMYNVIYPLTGKYCATCLRLVSADEVDLGDSDD